MIYINQIGQCELGRGKTLEAAVADANKHGFEVTTDIRLHRSGWPCLTGEVVYCEEPLEGYNA